MRPGRCSALLAARRRCRFPSNQAAKNRCQTFLFSLGLIQLVSLVSNEVNGATGLGSPGSYNPGQPRSQSATRTSSDLTVQNRVLHTKRILSLDLTSPCRSYQTILSLS